MNKKLVVFHLTEAVEQLQSTLADISQHDEYAYGNFLVDMQHVYYHLNTGWNAKDAPDAVAEPGSDELFNRWGQFPTDLP
jgi:hypothetical protein